MYKTYIRVFGNYVCCGYSETYKEALAVADEQYEDGWLYVRIEHPNGSFTQVHGEEAAA